MIRMMKSDGYRAEYAAALTAAVSILGPIIPPSISMIVYALAYPDVNLVGLMIAGVLPGIVIALAMAAINHVVSDAPRLPRRRRELCASPITCATPGARCPRSCCRC